MALGSTVNADMMIIHGIIAININVSVGGGSEFTVIVVNISTIGILLAIRIVDRMRRRGNFRMAVARHVRRQVPCQGCQMGSGRGRRRGSKNRGA